MPFKMTVAAMIKIAYWAQNQCSYQRAEDALYEHLQIKVSDDVIRKVTNCIGSIVFEEDCRRANESFNLLQSAKMPYSQDRNGVLYIEADGATINTRKKNVSGSTWRENKLGVVFSSDNIRYWTDKKGILSHEILKREYTGYIGSIDEFKKHLLACALRNGYGDYKETVVLGDGAAWIRTMTDEVFYGAQQILDYCHLCENVYEYAKHLHKMVQAKYMPWAKDICKALKESRYKQVLNELKGYEDKNFGQDTVNLYGYISNNIRNIDYATYEQKGYFIGSGAIESGNKIVLQQRLKQAGMRWNEATAQTLLTLRAKVESGLWKEDVEKLVFKHFANESLKPTTKP